jgi:hypothetical protein
MQLNQNATRYLSIGFFLLQPAFQSIPFNRLIKA